MVALGGKPWKSTIGSVHDRVNVEKRGRDRSRTEWGVDMRSAHGQQGARKGIQGRIKQVFSVLQSVNNFRIRDCSLDCERGTATTM